jgi:lambda family phage portal protein
MSFFDKIANRLGFVRKPNGKAQKRFKAADGNRLLSDWTPKRAALNQLISAGLVKVRDRARELARDDAYYKGFLGLCKRNIVGECGFKLEMSILDSKDQPDKIAERIIKDGWKRFCKAKNFTVSKDMSYFEFQSLRSVSVPPSGELLLRKVKNFNNEFGFAIQVLESDCLDETYNENFGDGRFVRMGVEFNANKERIAYHILSRNPYDLQVGGSATRPVRQRIPASEIIHKFIRLDVNQIRGFPWGHAALVPLQMLDGYKEAALVHARSAACQMGWITNSLDSGGSMPVDDRDAVGNSVIEQEPGLVRELSPGQSFLKWDPDHPNANHAEFCKTELRSIATAFEVSYNSMANDLESVNYSSMRAGYLDERETWKMLQRWYIEADEEIFEEWLGYFVTVDEEGAKLLKRYSFDQLNKPCFIARRWPWVDPLKDVQASVLAIENGLTTRTDVVADNSGSLDENFDTLQSENEQAEAHGLKFSGLKGYQEPAPDPAEAPAAPAP